MKLAEEFRAELIGIDAKEIFEQKDEAIRCMWYKSHIDGVWKGHISFHSLLLFD